MNIQPDAQTTDAADKPKEQGVLCSKDLLAAVEQLRESWGERAYYLEQLAGYDKDVISMRHREHAKIIRNCISELYRTVEAANAPGEPPARK